MKEENEFPLWISWLMVVSLMLFIFFIVKFEVQREHRKHQERLIKDFSRMSDSKEIQDAYEELYPLNENKDEYNIWNNN